MRIVRRIDHPERNERLSVVLYAPRRVLGDFSPNADTESAAISLIDARNDAARKLTDAETNLVRTKIEVYDARKIFVKFTSMSEKYLAV